MNNIDKFKAKIDVLKHDNREIAKGSQVSTGVKLFNEDMVKENVIPENVEGRKRTGLYPTLSLAKQVADLFTSVEDGEEYRAEYEDHIQGNKHLYEYDRRGIKPIVLLKVVPEYRVSSYSYQDRYYKMGLIRMYDNEYVLPIFGDDNWPDAKAQNIDLYKFR